MDLKQLLEQENLRNTPFDVFLSLKDNIDDLEILSEICTHINFENKTAFFDSVKKFLIDYGKRLSLGDGKEMAEQIKDDHFDKAAYRMAEESIIMTMNRPALLIRNDRIADSINTTWKNRIDGCSERISRMIPSVGRIEIKGHPQYQWVGTGWLVKGTDIIVTNRHVANSFASRQGNSFDINTDYTGQTLGIFIDFKEEHEVDEEREFSIQRVIHIAENDEPDIALLQVSPKNKIGWSLPAGLEIASAECNAYDKVFVVGYPAYNNSSKDHVKIYDFIFKGIYDVKRLAPGEVFPSSAASYIYGHDCSTWYGNSGSPLINFGSGKVVGVHYAGAHEELRRIRANWAVRSTYVLELFRELKIPY